MLIRNAGIFVFMLVILTISYTHGRASDSLATDMKKWEVARPYGPADTVRFTVREGTWMNLDVHPLGAEIVFDLLGDIYTVPISGGRAKLISGGLPIEVQPRYSPDGERISFTSDRAGGDNIWIMNRDGSGRHAVTEEDFRLLNNAVWMPDGQYLVARKHFTSERSLGAGEMWMYHIAGGAGLQLTERKNDQQDAGEPCVSPDGRYVYYSEDMSGGSTFQYNKDPNDEIYVIRRLDLQTGKLIDYVTGPGGAVRPQVSPDGRYLAFVRRVRAETVLFLHEIDTGREWPVYDQLSRDQQETWAIFGVYPNYAWMPDGTEIVIWAKGKIRRINIATRKATETAIEVPVGQIVSRALHVKQPGVGKEEFQARMLRHAVTSPDGKWVVFNAAGHLWKMKLPDGNPKRLTDDAINFEFEPDFSPNGKWVVYTTWNDTAHGAIRKVALAGGKPLKLTRRKGFFYSPRFSPDGTIVVYQRAAGNMILGYAHDVEPGIYWIAARDGGTGNLVVEEGARPRFDKSGTRVYYFLDSGDHKTLKSVTIDGGDPRTHFTSTYATEVAISPDEKWVAFQELFNVYITPFPRTGGTVELSSESEAIPVRRVSRDAGDYLHWSKDSRNLHWLVGPQYFTRELSRSFSFVEGAPDSIPGPEAQGIELSVFLPADIPGGKLALKGARIITMKENDVIEDGVIVVDRNRIDAVGTAAGVAIPADATVVDVGGKTIIPGLIDVHAHMWHNSGKLSTRQNWTYMANLAYGITTVHDPSADTEMVFSQSEMVRSGEMTGPRVFSTGTILYGAEGDFKAVVNDIEDARSHLRRMKAVGAFSVKSYNQPRRNQRQQVMQAARELGMMVVPEGGSFFFHNMSMILDGHTGIEHNIPVAPAYADVLNLWAASGTGYTPTLVVSYGCQSGERYWYQHTRVWEKDRLLTFVPRPLIDARSRRRSMSPDEEYGHFEHARTVTALSDAGVRVNIGGHGQMQGLAAHWEIRMFTQGGMSALEALRAATLNGAYYIGMEDDLGSLEAGKLADLVVLDADPLEDIQNTEKVRYVMKNGRLYDAATLNEIGNHPRERLPFYWEDPGVDARFVWKGDNGPGAPRCVCGHP